LVSCNSTQPGQPTLQASATNVANTPPPPTKIPTATPTEVIIPTPSTQMPPAYIFDQNKRLGRGVNLGNALEAPNEGDWGVVLEADFFKLIKEAGFNSIRIPIRWNAHAKLKSPYTIAPDIYARVDWAIRLASEQGLVAIIDFHHYTEMMTNPKEHQERFLGIWQQIAEYYKDYPDNLYFELLNEPNTGISAPQWNQIARAAIAVIRYTNPTRPIIVGPVGWNAYDQIERLKLPEEDRNLIATFHYYLPFQFTHQGAEWASGSDAWLGTTWNGERAEKDIITWNFDLVDRWAKQNNRPVFLGEFGAYSKADIDSRARWTDHVARQAEAHGFSWAYWEFCAGFGVYDRALKAWNEPILKALIP